MGFARIVARELDAEKQGTLSDFARGRLLGILDGLLWSKSISENMHGLLQIAIQRRTERMERSKPHVDGDNLSVNALAAGYVGIQERKYWRNPR